MNDKKPLKLEIKKKESSPITAAPKAQASTTEHIPQTGTQTGAQTEAQTGGIKLILKNAKIHIDQVIIRKK